MDKYYINDHIVWERAGVQEDDDYIVLNEITNDVMIVNYSAALVLNYLKEGLSMEELIDEISANYRVEKTVLYNDITEIIAVFLKHNIIVG